jgi:hypothetical protein
MPPTPCDIAGGEESGSSTQGQRHGERWARPTTIQGGPVAVAGRVDLYGSPVVAERRVLTPLTEVPESSPYALCQRTDERRELSVGSCTSRPVSGLSTIVSNAAKGQRSRVSPRRIPPRRTQRCDCARLAICAADPPRIYRNPRLVSELAIGPIWGAFFKERTHALLGVTRLRGSRHRCDRDRIRVMNWQIKLSIERALAKSL